MHEWREAMHQMGAAQDAAAQASRFCHSAINAALAAAKTAERAEEVAQDTRRSADKAGNAAKQCIEAEQDAQHAVRRIRAILIARENDGLETDEEDDDDDGADSSAEPDHEPEQRHSVRPRYGRTMSGRWEFVRRT